MRMAAVGVSLWSFGGLSFWAARSIALSHTSAGSSRFGSGLSEGVSDGGVGPFWDVVVIADSFLNQTARLEYIIGHVESATDILNS